MATFHLKVLTVDRLFFEGEVDRVIVRASTGDVGILANHVPYTAALGVGGLTIVKDGKPRYAAVSGGFIDVSKEQTVILARTCEWSEEIDVNRAKEAAEAAKANMQKKASSHEHDVAQLKLRKALNRIRISEQK